VSTWAAPADGEQPGRASTVTFDIEPSCEIVRLTVTHEDLFDDEERLAASAGWAAVMSNLI
jgi:hypothetical protein